MYFRMCSSRIFMLVDGLRTGTVASTFRILRPVPTNSISDPRNVRAGAEDLRSGLDRETIRTGRNGRDRHYGSSQHQTKTCVFHHLLLVKSPLAEKQRLYMRGVSEMSAKVFTDREVQTSY